MAASESSLLCESCGYTLDGLDPAGDCPECGRAIAESQPAARPGSPWQRRRGLWSWRRTCIEGLRHPARLMRIIRIDHPPTGFMVINFSLAAIALGFAIHLYALRVPIFLGFWIDLGVPMRTTPGLLVSMPMLAAVLYGLTRIEGWGLRFIGARRGFRITPAVSSSICAHASVAWVVAGSLTLLAVGVGSHFWRRSLSDPLPLTPALVIGLGAAGFFIGMLIFDILAWIGLRQCRFANGEGRTSTEPQDSSVVSGSPLSSLGHDATSASASAP